MIQARQILEIRVTEGMLASFMDESSQIHRFISYLKRKKMNGFIFEKQFFLDLMMVFA